MTTPIDKKFKEMAKDICSKHYGIKILLTEMVDANRLVEMIVQALTDERERCAVIVEAENYIMVTSHDDIDEIERDKRVRKQMRKECAAAIRGARKP